MNRLGSSWSRQLVALGLGLAATLIPPSYSFYSSNSSLSAKGAPKGTPFPLGMIIPVSLEHSLNSNELSKGEILEGRVTQDVPLPDKSMIPSGSKIIGTVLKSIPAGPDETGATITIRFDSLEFHSQVYPISVGLRVMAPFSAIQNSQTSKQTSSVDAPSGWSNSVQIGGDIRYGNGGKVTNKHKRVVGKGVPDGVLGHLDDAPD